MIALRCSRAKPPSRVAGPSATAAQRDASHLDVESMLVLRAPGDVQGGHCNRNAKRAQAVKGIDNLGEAQPVEFEFDRVLLHPARDGFLGRRDRADLFLTRSARERLLDYREEREIAAGLDRALAHRGQINTQAP